MMFNVQYQCSVVGVLLYTLLLQGCQSQLHMTPEEDTRVTLTTGATLSKEGLRRRNLSLQRVPQGRDSRAESHALEKTATHSSVHSAPLPTIKPASTDVPYDVFISHAGEDKEIIATPLYEILTARGVKVFLDQEELRTGEHAPYNMEVAMKTALCGVFILSPEFTAKKWPMKELYCFLARRELAKQQNCKLPNLVAVFYRLPLKACNNPTDLFDHPSNVNVFEKHGFNARMRKGETNHEKVKNALRQLSEYTGIEVEAGEGTPQLIRTIVDKLCSKVEELRTLHKAKSIGLVRCISRPRKGFLVKRKNLLLGVASLGLVAYYTCNNAMLSLPNPSATGPSLTMEGKRLIVPKSPDSSIAGPIQEKQLTVEDPYNNIRELRAHYLQDHFTLVKSLFPGESPKHVGKLACTLELIEQDRPSDMYPHQSRPHWKRTTIVPSALFEQRSNKSGETKRDIRRVLIVGNPGMGKTTLTKQLAYR